LRNVTVFAAESVRRRVGSVVAEGVVARLGIGQVFPAITVAAVAWSMVRRDFRDIGVAPK
jgi:hypothetical protein